MIYIDEITKIELTESEIDLETGFLFPSIYDGEECMMYAPYTPEEIKERRIQRKMREFFESNNEDKIDALMEAVVETGYMLAEQNQMNSDIMDAMMELAGMIATSQEGE